MIGETLSHYKVIEKIGQGGMGEVYRAEDTNLSREVAIKVLPEQFTKDPQRLARFEREAKLLASLNHPNIAAIHSFEHSDEIHFLVLELVPGETLAERVAKGPVPVEEALEICRQIAEGVEAAHEKGVIHRDLKPANVKVTPEGKVKILDFGLAKAFEEETPVTDISQSPTLTEEMTRAGVILGTAAYMSPEQAKGKPVDKRTDIFAFGSVLYELLTGKRAFEGETITETIAAVLKSEPDWDALPAAASNTVRLLLSLCFQKDPDDRLRDIGDFRALSTAAALVPTETIGAIKAPFWRRAIPGAAVGLMVVIAGLILWNSWLPVPETASLRRLSISLPSSYVRNPGELAFPSTAGSSMALSPDSRHLVYIGREEDQEVIFLRVADQSRAVPMSGTEGASHPFFSPNSEWIGFFANGQIKKVKTAGGTPITVCDVETPFAGASWSADGTIIFAGLSGLYSVSAEGGIPESVASVDGEESYRWPEILPGGRAVLFTIRGPFGGGTRISEIAVLSLDTGETKTITEGTYPRYSPTGHMMFVRAGSLMAVPFDPMPLQQTGDPVSVLEDAWISGVGVAHFSFSEDGTLVYLPALEGAGARVLLWVDREGATQPIMDKELMFASPHISPDGKRLVVGIGTTEMVNSGDLWIYELERGTLTRLTFGDGNEETSTWTPDGQRVAYTKGQSLHWKLADGSGSEELLAERTFHTHIGSWLPDGGMFAFEERDPGTQYDIWFLPLGEESEPRTFLNTRFNEYSPRFSPNGRWLAYVSDESGRPEVYLQPYPGPGGKTQISTDGGSQPVWSREGDELFYQYGNQFMAVAIDTRGAFSASPPRLLFEGNYAVDGSPDRYRPNYDVMPDGRFVMVKAVGREGEEDLTQINIVLNWFEELKRLVPTP